jgi:hypothetical protein
LRECHLQLRNECRTLVQATTNKPDGHQLVRALSVFHTCTNQCAFHCIHVILFRSPTTFPLGTKRTCCRKSGVGGMHSCAMNMTICRKRSRRSRSKTSRQRVWLQSHCTYNCLLLPRFQEDPSPKSTKAQPAPVAQDPFQRSKQCIISRLLCAILRSHLILPPRFLLYSSQHAHLFLSHKILLSCSQHVHVHSHSLSNLSHKHRKRNLPF